MNKRDRWLIERLEKLVTETLAEFGMAVSNDRLADSSDQQLASSMKKIHELFAEIKAEKSDD
jgi:hypothetical protein